MNINQLQAEIKETNFSYMLLAQQMIREDKASAIFRLGISEEMATLIDGLSPAQIMKMSSANMLLCSFRFDERLLANMITDYSKDRLMSKEHAAIMLSGRHVEAMAV